MNIMEAYRNYIVVGGLRGQSKETHFINNYIMDAMDESEVFDTNLVSAIFYSFISGLIDIGMKDEAGRCIVEFQVEYLCECEEFFEDDEWETNPGLVIELCDIYKEMMQFVTENAIDLNLDDWRKECMESIEAWMAEHYGEEG